MGRGLLDCGDAYARLYAAASHHIGIDQFTATEADRSITDGLDYAAGRTHAATP
ncbi:hypothetical protein ACFXG4_41125 [Nocardia sp. NPDC059246]|uniref:hypothetical protein n=1 Tax=unclassified Nocardia TaxID=2637762 RepID=UPI0036940E3C